MPAALVWAGLVLGIIVIVVLVAWLIAGNRKTYRQRLDEYGATRRPRREARSRPALQRQITERLDRALVQTARGKRLHKRLARAGLPFTPGQIVLVNSILVVLGGLLGWLIRQDIGTTLILALVAGLIPRFWISRLVKQRTQQFADQLPDTLRVMIGALRVGSSLAQSCQSVSELAPEPTRTEFQRVVQEVMLGRTLSQAISALSDRMDCKDVQLLAAAIRLNADVGGNLIAVLSSTAQVIRERARLAREIRVLNAQQIMTGNLLMVLPILVSGIIYLMNPSYMLQMFQPGITLCIPIGAVVLLIVGYVLMRSILSIEV